MSYKQVTEKDTWKLFLFLNEKDDNECTLGLSEHNNSQKSPDATMKHNNKVQVCVGWSCCAKYREPFIE